MDRSAEVQAIMQIMSNQDIQIKYAKEKAGSAKEKADKWTNTYNTLVDSKKATQLLLNKEYSKRLHDLTEKTQENAVEEPKVEINVEFHNGEKVEEKIEESEEVSVEEEVAVPCAESEEVVDNFEVMTQENAIFGKNEETNKS